MNLDFTHQLLLCATPLQRGLLNDFGSSDLLCVTLDKFIALSEATLAQEFSFQILSIADLSVLMLDSLLDNLSAAIVGRRAGHQISLTTAVLRSGHHRLVRRHASSCAWALRLSTAVQRILTIVI